MDVADAASSRAPMRTARRCSRATSTSAIIRSSRASGRRKGSIASRAASRSAIARAIAYAPYADVLWCETSTPDIGEAREFAEGVHASPSRQAAGVQLLAVVQLGEEAFAGRDRELPARARRDGLQVPVRHAGRLPRAQLLDVRARAAVPRRRDGGVLAHAAGGVRRRSSTATPRRATSAKSAPATSTRWPRR